MWKEEEENYRSRNVIIEEEIEAIRTLSMFLLVHIYISNFLAASDCLSASLFGDELTEDSWIQTP